MRTHIHSPCHSLLRSTPLTPSHHLPTAAIFTLLPSTRHPLLLLRLAPTSRPGPARSNSTRLSPVWLETQPVHHPRVESRRGESGFSIDRGAETSDARNVAFNKEQTVATATTSPVLPSALCSLPIKLMKKRKEPWRDSEEGVKEVEEGKEEEE